MNEDLERRIRTSHAEGHLAKAMTTALKGYGQEVMGFLYLRTGRNEAQTGDAFSLLSENLWRGLPRFEWRSSFRTWMYVLARNSASRVTRDAPKARIQISEISDLVDEVRSTTLSYLKTDKRERFQQLRQALSSDDEQLLALRVTRGLSWKEIAAVFEGLEAPEEAELARHAARYRQRFKSLKDRLKNAAQ